MTGDGEGTWILSASAMLQAQNAVEASPLCLTHQKESYCLSFIFLLLFIFETSSPIAQAVLEFMCS